MEFCLIAVMKKRSKAVNGRMIVNSGYLSMEALERAIRDRLEGPTKYDYFIAVRETGETVRFHVHGNNVDIPSHADHHTFEYWQEEEEAS